MAERKDILNHRRIRKIGDSFSWLDHRFITGGFLDDLATIEIVLYFFLVAVSNRYGLSFYHDDRICRILKIELSCLGQAREGLIQRSLIAYRYLVYQVLALPPTLVVPPTKEEQEDEKRQRNLLYIQRIKRIVTHGSKI